MLTAALLYNAGIDRVGLDGTLYDQVLDFIFYLGLAPPRFQVPFSLATDSQPLQCCISASHDQLPIYATYQAALVFHGMCSKGH